jgi:hypothetical protein
MDRMETPPKLAVVVRSDLETWQKLNVTAFLVSGFGTRRPDVIGDDYADASSRRYLPMFGHPVLVYAGDAAAVTRAFGRAQARDLATAVFTDDLFATGNDVDNRAAVAKVATADLSLAGFAIVGDSRDVDKALDKLKLHP